MQYSYTLLLLILATLSSAQTPYSTLDPAGIGRGNTFSAQEGPTALFVNPAGIASVSDFSILLISQNIGGRDGLTSSGFGLLKPTSLGVFSVGIYYSGDTHLNWSGSLVSWGQKLGIAELGFRTGVIRTSLKDSWKKTLFLLDISGVVELSSHVTIGAGVLNLTRSGYSKEDKLPVTAFTSINVSPVETFNAVVEIEKDLQQEPDYKVGLSYLLKKRIEVSTGISFNPVKQTVGLGFLLKKISIIWALENLPGLGSRQTLALVYRKPSKR